MASRSQRDYSPSEDTEKYSSGKGAIELIEVASPLSPVDPDAQLSAEERARIDKALVRKLDWKLIPWLTLLYLSAFLDRTNIGNAKVDGLQKDLNMTQGQYLATLSIFFVSYALFGTLTLDTRSSNPTRKVTNHSFFRARRANHKRPPQALPPSRLPHRHRRPLGYRHDLHGSRQVLLRPVRRPILPVSTLPSIKVPLARVSR